MNSSRFKHWVSLFAKPRKLVDAFILKGPRMVSDKAFIECLWRSRMNYPLDLINPQTFNEKLQWLKLYNHNPLYTTMVDKYAVKEYVANIIGEKYIIPTYGVWDRGEDIEWERLPNQFVMKCTHDSGGLVICKDKSKLNKTEAINKLNKCLETNFYLLGREWPYKHVRPRIIAEKLLEENENGTSDLRDYKLMCFNGKVKCSFVCSDRFNDEGLKVTFFDIDWKKMPFCRHYPSASYEIAAPESYRKMVELAEKLSEGIPFVRVDFYELNKVPYFGEMTFFPGNGMEEFEPEEWDDILGEWIKLPINNE